MSLLSVSMKAKKPAPMTAASHHAGQSGGSDSPPSNNFGEEGGEGANSFNGHSRWSNRILPKMAKIRLTFKEELFHGGGTTVLLDSSSAQSGM